jgi:hypothetical protein
MKLSKLLNKHILCAIFGSIHLNLVPCQKIWRTRIPWGSPSLYLNGSVRQQYHIFCPLWKGFLSIHIITNEWQKSSTSVSFYKLEQISNFSFVKTNFVKFSHRKRVDGSYKTALMPNFSHLFVHLCPRKRVDGKVWHQWNAIKPHQWEKHRRSKKLAMKIWICFPSQFKPIKIKNTSLCPIHFLPDTLCTR